MSLEQKISETPLIPDVIYDRLPALLKKSCEEFSEKRERDVFLIGAFGVLSGCMEGIKGRYHFYEFYANLYVIVAAPPGSGKGALVFSRYLGLPYHKKIRGQNRDLPMEEGSHSIRKDKVLFIPGNVSSAMFYKHLDDNEGSGIIFETELDTFVKAQKQDWGNTSSELRDAFQHESITSSRKGKGGEYIEISEPRISCVFSGTFDQVRAFLPSTENGLYSRFLFYIFSTEPTWQSVKPCTTCETPKEKFLQIGEEVCDMIDFNKRYPAQFEMTDEQWSTIDKYFARQLSVFTALHGDETQGLVKRMGVNVFRLAMITSAITRWENKNTQEKIQCTEEDFNTAMTMGDVYLQHLGCVYQLTQSSPISTKHANKVTFFNSLGAEFTKQDALKVGEKLSRSSRTVEEYLKQLCEAGLLERTQQGHYQKKQKTG